MRSEQEMCGTCYPEECSTKATLEWVLGEEMSP